MLLWMYWLGMLRTMRSHRDAQRLLESAAIQWARDWDAILIGFCLGVMATLLAIKVWV